MQLDKNCELRIGAHFFFRTLLGVTLMGALATIRTPGLFVGMNVRRGSLQAARGLSNKFTI